VERDTKIRVKYLSALEDGEFTELPGDVYTRGFLRNYASYLGLDADQIEEAWHEEAGSRPARQALVVGPQPIAIPSRGFVLQRSHFALLGVLVVVAIVVAYFGFQMTRFLSYPTLGVTTPNALNIDVPANTTGYTLNGTATAGSTVEIDQDASALQTVVADDAGHWSRLVTLHPGSNQFNVTARNLDTNHASKVTQIIIRVPEVTPTPPTPVVGVTTPTNGTISKNGKVTVTGTSRMVATVTLTAVYLGAPPPGGATVPPPATAGSPSPIASGSPGASASPSPVASKVVVGPSPSAGPSPVSVHPNTDGSYSLPITLGPGSWQLNVVGTAATTGRQTATASVTVSVPYTGVTVTVKIQGTGSGASVALWQDGVSIGGGIRPDGWEVTLVAARSVCIYTPRANNTFITINGLDNGTVGRFGGTHLYIDIAGPKNVASCPGG